MNDQLEYLRSVIEGDDNVERWSSWFDRNKDVLAKSLTRTRYLALKIRRIDTIPEFLDDNRIPFIRSSRYQWLAGVPGLCKECRCQLPDYERFQRVGSLLICPNGCMRNIAPNSMLIKLGNGSILKLPPILECEKCGQLFTLNCNTYPGRGGTWAPKR